MVGLNPGQHKKTNGTDWIRLEWYLCHPPAISTVLLYLSGLDMMEGILTKNIFLDFRCIYLVLYKSKLLDIKKRPAVTSTVSYESDSCPFD